MKHLLRFKTFLLLAIFSLLAGTSAWAQSDFSSTETSNVTLIKGTNASDCTVNGKDGIKVGTSKAGGDMSVTVPAGTTHLHLHASAWKGVTGLSLNISGATVSPKSISLTANDGISNNSPFTLSGKASDYYFVIELSGITSATTLNFTTSTTKRFVIWGVNAETVIPGGSNLQACDLALDGAPVALSFDLYNNSASQTINYTTSSTGLIDIDGEYNFPYVGTYATFDVDEVNKTITVTPTAVTPSTQTITVNQTGDSDYYGGSVTFKLDITDSTPLPTHTATFSINGTTSSEDFEEGSAIVFPTNIADIEGKQFVGWTLDEISGTTDTAPALVNSAAMGTSDVTYYAVFATVSGSFSQETITIDKDTQNVPTSYGDAKTFNLYTFEGIDFSVRQMYLNGEKLQWRAAGNTNGTGTMYNNDDLGKITSVVLTYNSDDTNKNFTLEIGNNADPTGGQAITPTVNGSVYTFDCSAYDYGYFVMTNGSGAGYLDKLVINYTTGSAIISGYCTTVAADNRLEPGLAFYPATATYDFGIDTFVSLSYNTGFNGYDEVTYSSSDEDVVQVVDAQTGEIYMKSAGTATITATFLGNNEYKPGTATLEITVNDSRTPTTISQDPIVLDLSEVGTLTKLAPVVKDENDNVVAYSYGQWPTEVSFEVVNDPNSLIGSLDNNSGDITINSVQGTATLKAYYNYYNVNSTYRPSECTFTISVLEPKDGIAEFCTLNNNESGTLKLTNAVVLYTHGNDMFVKDATGAMDFYSTSLSYNVGDVLNGTITGTYKLYNNMPELTTPISENTLVATAGSAPTPDEITTSDAADNVCNLVKLSSAAVTENSGKFYVDNVQIYDKFKLGYTIEAGKTYDIVGIMIPYNSTYEICPTEAPVEVSTSTTPSITIDPATYTMDAKAGGGEIPVVSENLASDPQLAVVFVEADGVTPATYDWITATINNNGNIDGHIETNTGAERTAYFYVTGKDANGNTVQSNLVTFTQEAPVAATPTIVFNPESIDFDANGGYRTIGGDYFQLKDFDSTPSLEILYYESDGDTEKQGGYDWLTADFNSNNQIDFTWGTNTGAARTAYLKIHAVGTTVYSNLFTVNQAAPTTDYVTLPFNWAGGASADLTAIAGVTASGIGSDYAATHDPYLVKFDSDGDYIQFKTNEQPGVVTIGVKMIGGGNTSTITVQGSADGDKFTDIEELTISGKQNDIVNLETTTSFAATDRYVRLTFTKGSNVGVGPITIAKYVATPSITITPATVNAKANDNGGELTVTYENLAATPNLQIVFVESDGETAATYNWISAEFNSNGNIDGILQPNTGDARTAYLVVTGVDADNNVVKSNLVTINQAAPAAPSITVEKGSIDFVAGGESDRKMSFEYESLGNSPSFEVVFFDELGTTVTTYDWVTTATIENNEKVNLSVAQNDGAARTAYFKVHETATDVYSNLVTINQAAAADPNTIIFDFTTNDWGLPLTSENVSERREFKKDGYTIALTAGGNNKYGFNTDGYLLLGKNGATLEFPIFDFLVDKITIEGNTGASTSVKQAIYMKTYSEGLKQASSTTTGATGTNEYNISWGCQAAGEELLLQVTSAHNTQITRILIHKKETVDVTIGSTGYATLYYGDKNFSYGRKGGVSAYAVNLTNGALKMEAISNQAVIPAGTAMVLEGNPGTHVFEVEDAAFSSIAAEAEVNFTGCDNLLRGYDEPALTTGPDAGDYLFYLLGVDNGKVGFYWGKADGAAFKSGAHKAYLAVPTEVAAGVRGFTFDGTTVGINTIGVDMPEGNAYDLQGRRVQQFQKNGLYIVDGKKMLAK